jgi:hypothetical protein
MCGTQTITAKNLPQAKRTGHTNPRTHRQTIPNRNYIRSGSTGTTQRPPPPLPTQTPQPGNDLTGLTQMMKNLMDQMGTLINLISALVTKQNK